MILSCMRRVNSTKFDQKNISFLSSVKSVNSVINNSRYSAVLLIPAFKPLLPSQFAICHLPFAILVRGQAEFRQLALGKLNQIKPNQAINMYPHSDGIK